ncbi:MAG: cupin-like domain-containing protein [Myxococcota bacterium]|nr:cupin-like domain-containing protein [Myxococcota bacterium]
MASSIPRIPSCDVDGFRREYVTAARPVVVTGMLSEWPAFQEWSFPRLAERFGDRLVTVGETREGRLVVDPKVGIPQREVAFGEYLGELEQGDPGWYLLSPVDERLPELLEEVRYPRIVAEAAFRSVRMWLGAEGVVSALHHDLPENFLAQVIGRKKVILVDKRHRRGVYRNGILHGAPNFCRVDAENPDYERHPRFRGVPTQEVVLEPGEMLFIPRFWFHQLRTLDPSLSVNLWFADGLLALAARASQLYARMRNLRK